MRPGLSWLGFWAFHYQPDCPWADGNLAEVAGHLGNMAEHTNHSKSTNPGLSQSACIILYVGIISHFCIQNHPLPVPERAPLEAPLARGRPGSRWAAGLSCNPGLPSTSSCKQILVILASLAKLILIWQFESTIKSLSFNLKSFHLQLHSKGFPTNSTLSASSQSNISSETNLSWLWSQQLYHNNRDRMVNWQDREILFF